MCAALIQSAVTVVCMGMFSQGGRAHQYRVHANQGNPRQIPNIRDEPRYGSTHQFGGINGRSDGANSSGLGNSPSLFQSVMKSFSGLGYIRPSGRGAAHEAGSLATATLPPPETTSIVEITTELPITKHRQQIERAVMLSDETIIVGETGSGKSLATPEFLQKLGFKVIVLQPRRVAASSLAERLSTIKETELGSEVGYRHGLAQSRSHSTEILYSTFGSQLRAELNQASSPKTVIVFDEFHELTAEAEFLLGFLRMQRELTGSGPKVVIMSATMDSQRLSDFLGGAPIVHVEGRRFGIEHLKGSGKISDDIAHAVELRLNTLAFFYGKSEIADHMEQVGSMGLPVDLIPFHSGLSPAELNRAFGPYKRTTAIFGTNAAQTSLTLSEVDRVIVSGKVRRSTVSDGIESLIIDEVSQSEVLQQMGRVGRTKPGQVISYARPIEELSKDVPAELQNIHIDGLYLRTVAAGQNFEQINRYCYNPAHYDQIEDAQSRLQLLGLMGPRGHLTSAGKFAAELPVAPYLGKVLYSSVHEGTIHNRQVLERAIDMAAVAEGEIFATGQRAKMFEIIGQASTSEATVQGALLEVVLRDGVEALEGLTIDTSNLDRAIAIRGKIRESLGLRPNGLTEADRDGFSTRILNSALYSGYVDSVFRFTHHDEKSGNPIFRHILHGGQWLLSKESMVDDRRFVIGRPLNIEYVRSDGEIGVVSVITMTSAVEAKWLKNNLPEKVRDALIDELRKERNNEDRLKAIARQREFHRPSANHGRGGKRR